MTEPITIDYSHFEDTQLASAIDYTRKLLELGLPLSKEKWLFADFGRLVLEQIKRQEAQDV